MFQGKTERCDLCPNLEKGKKNPSLQAILEIQKTLSNPDLLYLTDFPWGGWRMEQWISARRDCFSQWQTYMKNPTGCQQCQVYPIPTWISQIRQLACINISFQEKDFLVLQKICWIFWILWLEPFESTFPFQEKHLAIGEFFLVLNEMERDKNHKNPLKWNFQNFYRQNQTYFLLN